MEEGDVRIDIVQRGWEVPLAQPVEVKLRGGIELQCKDQAQGSNYSGVSSGIFSAIYSGTDQPAIVLASVALPEEASVAARAMSGNAASTSAVLAQTGISLIS